MKRSLSVDIVTITFRSILITILLLFTPAFNYCQSRGIDNEIIEYKTVCKLDEGKLVVERSYVFQINNKNGDWLAEISIPFTKKENVESLEAWISNSSGEIIRKLKNKDIVDKSEISEISLYEDDYIKTFELKHNKYPYRIHYSYKHIYQEFIAIDYWSPLIYNKTPTWKASLRLELPVWYEVNILQKNIQEPTIDTVLDNVFYFWEDSFVKPIHVEIFSPPLGELMPVVKIVPKKFNYGVSGNFTSWKTFGDWQCDLNKGMNDLPVDEKLAVENLTGGIDDPVEKIRILYHYLQDNTRYINVSIDVGGLKPYPASYVSSKKYGDCKALSNYMQALLAEAGIESYYTIIYGASNKQEISKEFVGPQFNHVVLFVPIGNDTIWLETTDRNNPFGYFGVFTQNRTAFAIVENESRLVRTPELTHDEVKEEKHAVIKLGGAKSCKINIKDRLRGNAFEKVNGIYTSYSEYETKRIIPEYLIPFKLFELHDWKIEKPGRDIAAINLEYMVEVPNYIKVYDGSKIIPILSSRLPNLEKPDKRKYPLRINYPICRLDSLVYDLDLKLYSEVRIPKGDTIQSKFGRYVLKCNQFEDHILVVKEYELNSGKYSLEEYKEFYNFINKIKSYERKNSIVLK